MPTSYNVTDVGVIRAPISRVWGAFISEFAGAKDWWMPFWESQPLGEPPVKVGTRFNATVHPPGWYRRLLFTPRFTVLVTELREGEYIRVEFPEGHFSGVGTFDFTTVENGDTQVSFNWDVTTRGLRPGIVAWLVNIGAVHSMVVEGGYRGLNRWLENNSVVPEPHFKPTSKQPAVGQTATDTSP